LIALLLFDDPQIIPHFVVDPSFEFEVQVGAIEHVQVSIAIDVIGAFKGSDAGSRPNRWRSLELLVDESTCCPDGEVCCRCRIDIHFAATLSRNIVVHCYVVYGVSLFHV